MPDPEVLRAGALPHPPCCTGQLSPWAFRGCSGRTPEALPGLPMKDLKLLPLCLPNLVSVGSPFLPCSPPHRGFSQRSCEVTAHTQLSVRLRNPASRVKVRGSQVHLRSDKSSLLPGRRSGRARECGSVGRAEDGSIFWKVQAPAAGSEGPSVPAAASGQPESAGEGSGGARRLGSELGVLRRDGRSRQGGRQWWESRGHPTSRSFGFSYCSRTLGEMIFPVHFAVGFTRGCPFGLMSCKIAFFSFWSELICTLSLVFKKILNKYAPDRNSHLLPLQTRPVLFTWLSHNKSL